MKKLIYIISLFFALQAVDAQNTAFTKMIDATLQKTVPLISVSELKLKYNDFVILDSREEEEYKTSHLKDAKFVGYTKFKLQKTIKNLSKKKPIVVYCSIGYRSEKIAEKLQKKGYKVYNLYGGIFDWKNKSNTVIDVHKTPTENVHTYNKKWSKWLLKGNKVYAKKPETRSKIIEN